MAITNNYIDNKNGTHTLVIKYPNEDSVNVLFDSKYYEKVKLKKWYINTKNNTKHIHSELMVNGKRTSISLRKYIAEEINHLNPNRVFLVNQKNPYDLREVNLSNVCNVAIYSHKEEDGNYNKDWVEGLKNDILKVGQHL